MTNAPPRALRPFTSLRWLAPIPLVMAVGCSAADPESDGARDSVASRPGGSGMPNPPPVAGTGDNGGANRDAGTIPGLAPTDSGTNHSGDDAQTTPSASRVAAGGIRLTDIVANQAIDFSVVKSRTAVAVDARTVPMIGGRAALLRANYTIDNGFTSRAIEALLVLTHTDGTTTTLSDKRTVSKPATMTELDGTFHWFIDPANVRSGTQYHVAFVEADGVAAPTGDATASRFPAAGEAALGAWGDRMVLDLVVVPYDCGGGRKKLNLSGQDLKDFEGFIFNTYPVQAVHLTVHSVMQPSKCDEFSVAEYDLPKLRVAEKAPPYVYYGGLLNGDGGGYSIPIENSADKSFRRTFASNAWRDYGLTQDLFAHELGHSHGRRHTFEDPKFPGDTRNQCGARGEIGFGIQSFWMPQSAFGNDRSLNQPWIDPHTRLLAATNASNCHNLNFGNLDNWNDIMSYTYPFWISAYTYAALAERVRLISSWSSGTTATDILPGRTLRAVFGASEGPLHWTHTAGAAPLLHSEGVAICFDGAREVGRFGVQTSYSRREHHGYGRALSETRYRTAEISMPEGLVGDRCEVAIGGENYSVSLASL